MRGGRENSEVGAVAVYYTKEGDQKLKNMVVSGC